MWVWPKQTEHHLIQNHLLLAGSQGGIPHCPAGERERERERERQTDRQRERERERERDTQGIPAILKAEVMSTCGQHYP